MVIRPHSRTSRVLYIICALALSASRPTPVRSQSSLEDQQLDAAIAAFERSDLSTARKLVQDCLAQNPRSAAAWNLKGLIDDSQKDFDSGGKDFVTALHLSPSASVYTNLGNHYLLLQDVVRARQAFAEALRLDPRHFTARFNLLTLVLNQAPCRQLESPAPPVTLTGNMAPAASLNQTSQGMRHGEASQACAQEALNLTKGLSPKELERPEVVALHVQALLAAGQPSAAALEAHKAMVRSPRDAKLAYSLGLELAQAGDAASAVPLLEHAESLLPPDQPDAKLLLGLGQAKFGAGLPATDEFLRLKELQPGWWQPYYYLALVAAHAKQYLQASALLVKAQQRAPSEPLIAAALANAAAAQGFWFDATDEWQRYIQLKPDDLRAYRELAIVAGVAHRRELAVSAMQRYLKAYPDDAEAYYMLALMEQDNGHRQEAVQTLRTCVGLKPDYVPAWTTLAKAEMNFGELDLAQEDLKRALEIDPRYAPAHLTLAEIENHQGHPELALPLLKQAVKEDPNNVAAYYQLTLAERRAGHPQAAQKAGAMFERLGETNSGNSSGRGLLKYLREDVELTPAEQEQHYLEFLRTALQTRPGDPGLLCRLGIAEIDRGQTASGLTHVKQALQPALPYDDALATAQALSAHGQGELALSFYTLTSSLPAAKTDARAALGEARLLLALGHADKALGTLDSVPADAQPKGEAADLAGLIYARLGVDQRALAAFRVAIALSPREEAFYRDMAVFLGSRARWDAALETLDEAKKKCGGSSSLTLDEAVLFELSGRRQQAQALLRRLAFDADDPALTSQQRLAALLLGVSYYMTNQRTEATTVFEQLTRSDPKLALAWYYRALIASESDQTRKALEWVSHSLAIEPRYPRALYLRGKLLADAGKLAEAQRDLEAAAAADPTWISPHYQLSRLFQRLKKPDLARKEADMAAQLSSQAQGSQSGQLSEYLDGLTLSSEP